MSLNNRFLSHACGFLTLIPLSAIAQTTIAQYDFTVTGKNYTTVGDETIATGSLFFKDDDSLIVKIANASTVEGYITGFFLLDPGDDPISYGLPIKDPGDATTKEWAFMDTLSTDLTGSGSPITSTDADNYFGAWIQGSPGDNGIPDKEDDPLDYHYFTFSFTDLDLVDIAGTYEDITSTLPAIAIRWRGLAGSPGSDKGYFETYIVHAPEPSMVVFMGMPLVGMLLTTRRRR